MGSRRLRAQEEFSLTQWQGIFRDDFTTYTDAALWTKTLTGGGSAVALQTGTALTDGFGVLNFLTGASANRGALIATTSSLFQFLNDRPISLECKIKFAEANTNNTMIGFGLTDTVNNTVIADTTGLFNLANEGTMIYLPQGQTQWWSGSKVNGATAITQQSTKTALYTGWQRLAINIDPNPGIGGMAITYEVENVGTPQPVSAVGSQLIYNNFSFKTPTVIRDIWAIPTTTQLYAFLIVKAGSGSAESMDCDYYQASVLRDLQ
jgi:hypothetical protein